jgi:hypothetical protein
VTPVHELLFFIQKVFSRFETPSLFKLPSSRCRTVGLNTRPLGSCTTTIEAAKNNQNIGLQEKRRVCRIAENSNHKIGSCAIDLFFT